MKTEVVKILPGDTENLEKAAKLIKSGEIVAIPTETVYGLAANVYDETAVRKIFKAKGRPQDNPLIVHISELSQLKEIAMYIPDSLKVLAEHFMPGPLTVVLPKNPKISDTVTAGLPSVAVRMPSHKTAMDFISACNVPLAAPSANISGSPSPTSAKHVFDDLNGKISMIIDGGECSVGVESTVISLLGDVPELLRPGAITLEQLQSVLGEVKVSRCVLAPLQKNEKASSPGMMHKHYSPKTKIITVKGSAQDFANYVNGKKNESVCALAFSEDCHLLDVPFVAFGDKNDLISQARRLFSSLREVDELDKEVCFAQLPSSEDIGLAVVNRLLRAAEFSVVQLDKKKDGDFTVVGLTGKTGSGKSSVCEILREKGAAIIDGDKVARELTTKDKQLLNCLKDSFGNDIVKGGKLNRRLLASRAFKNRESVDRLNRIMHPRITEYIMEELTRLRSRGFSVAVIDAAALIESKISEKCDVIAVTYAPQEERLLRIIKRDNITQEEALVRIRAQREDEFYNSRADYIIRCYEPFDVDNEIKPLLYRLGL